MQELESHPETHTLHHPRGCDCDQCLLSAMTSPVVAEQQQGWEAWYERDSTALGAYLARRCRAIGCPEQSEDLLQDCFVIGFRKIASGVYVKSGRPLLAYLYGIAKNLVRETVQLWRHEVAMDDLQEEELSSAKELSIEDLLYVRDVVAMVQAAHHRQPPMQQIILSSLYTEGKSSQLVALELRQSPGNTRIIATRAVDEIRRYLAHHHKTKISPGAIRSCLGVPVA